MKNKYIKILIVMIAILLFTVLVFYLKNRVNPTNSFSVDYHKKQIMTEEEKNSIGLYHLGEYEVLARDDSGKITTYRLNKLLDEKPIETEFMSDDAKKKQGFLPDVKIQVLQRDKSGKVLVYKIIKNDSDVMNKY
jgi:hypothetical protein